MPITKIISGGQTGADRGGLEAAIEYGIPHDGWCPKGRLAEDGVIPDKYELSEMASKSYLKRTEANVVDSDAIVIFAFGKLTGGSKRTAEDDKPNEIATLGDFLSFVERYLMYIKVPLAEVNPQLASGLLAQYAGQTPLMLSRFSRYH